MNGQTDAPYKILNEIRTNHVTLAETHITNSKIREDVYSRLSTECSKLADLLGVVKEIGEVSTENLDVIVSKGELLACHLMSGILEDQNVLVSCVDLSDVVVGDVEDLLLYRKASAAFVKKINECGDRIPVLTGHFGKIQGGLLNRMGRGYTDLCAALVAVGLQAQELQIWKEVDGIFTANPLKVPTARLLSTISPSEIAKLTFYGSEVIHPFTM